MQYAEVQRIAKRTIEFIKEHIHPGMTLLEVRNMCKFVTPEITFEELYYYINGIIEEKGYINLDFMGNLGHSIVRRKNDRVYTEKGNKMCLGDVSYFTFEPHISVKGSRYGYKRENIYYFKNGVIKEL